MVVGSSSPRKVVCAQTAGGGKGKMSRGQVEGKEGQGHGGQAWWQNQSSVQA